MIKIDLNKKFMALPGDNEDHSGDDPMCKVVAYLLSHAEESRDPVKLWGWAVRFATDGFIDIDKSDAEYLKSEIMKAKHFLVAGKAQVIEAINKAIDDETKVIPIKKED